MDYSAGNEYEMKLAALLYQAYKDKGNRSPYFDTFISLLFILFLHVLHVALFFRVPPEFLFPNRYFSGRGANRLILAIIFCVFLGLFALLFRKSSLEKYMFSQETLAKARRILVFYFIVSVVLLGVLLIRKGIEQGTI